MRAATCSTAGWRCPESLWNTGIISMSPCDDVKEAAKAPVSSAPWTAAAAPASDCISMSDTLCPKIFFLPSAAQASVFSAIGDDGVIG